MKLEELINLLKKAKSVEEIHLRKEEIGKLLPQIERMFDYDQQNQAHKYDLWKHTLHVVMNLPRNLEDDMLYLAALFHDIGKPDTRCSGKNTDDQNKHYYGHPKRSKEIVRDEIIPQLDQKGEILPFLEIKRLFYYIEYHDDQVALKLKTLNRHMKRASFEEFSNLMQLQIADAKAHVQLPMIKKRIEICSAWLGKEGNELYKAYLKTK